MYGVGGVDDVTFVGDVHGLAFLWEGCMSQSASHRCRASRSSWRAFRILLVDDGVVNYGVVSKKFYGFIFNIIREVVNVD